MKILPFLEASSVLLSLGPPGAVVGGVFNSLFELLLNSPVNKLDNPEAADEDVPAAFALVALPCFAFASSPLYIDHSNISAILNDVTDATSASCRCNSLFTSHPTKLKHPAAELVSGSDPLQM
jgi:hypothetical protein